MQDGVDHLFDNPSEVDSLTLAQLSSHDRLEFVEQAKRLIDEYARRDPPSSLPIAVLLGKLTDLEAPIAAIVYRGQATAFHCNGRSAEALEAYLKALEVYQADGDELESARVLRSLVDVHQLVGNPEQALSCAGRAREMLERLDEQRLLAQLETNVGNVYVRLDDYPQARASYQSACSRFENIQRPLDLAIARYNMAIVESQSGLFAEAEQTFRSAQDVFAEEGMDVHVADCLYMLSLVQSRRGSFAEAISGLEEARRMYAIFRKPRGMPLCDLDLAEIYLRLDARREAVTHAARAAKGFLELDLEYERAKAETILGVANLRLKDPVSAGKSFDSARSIFSRLKNSAWSAIVDVHRSEIDLIRGEAESAAGILRAAHSTLRAKGLALWSDLAAIALARALLSAGQVSQAENELESLISGRDQSLALDAIILGQAYRALAELRHSTGDHAKAMEALLCAVATVEGVLGELPQEDIRIAFFRRPHGAYVDLAYLQAVHEREGSTSLELLESGRFRSWAQPASASQSLSSARERLAWYLTSRLDAEVGGAGSDEELGGVGGNEGRLLEAGREVVRLRQSAPNSRFDIATLRDAVAPGETLLAFALSQFGALAYVLTSDRIDCVALDIDAAELERLRRKWFFQVGKLGFGERYSKRNQRQLAASSNALLDTFGQRLLAPVIEKIQTRALIVVPYGLLHGLPFHAFRLGGSWLADSNDVTYGLSVAHVALCRRKPSANRRVWVCRAEVDDLPALQQETESVTSVFGDDASLVATTELHGLLGQQREPGGVLHLASHGVFRPDNPVMSALLLGDTMLNVRELKAMNLNFDLVTLSGCETGRAQVSGGEEAFGLAHSFVRGGARGVLCSLWPVDDRASLEFMQAFYNRLAAGDTARSALAFSQREARQANPSASSWSSFILLGAPDIQIEAQVRRPTQLVS